MPDVWNEIALGRNRVRAALVAADGLSSQQVGENVTLSESLLLPPAVVAASPEKARQEQTYKRISEDEAFVLWAQQRKENAALARDDTDGLAGVFSTAKAFGESVANFGNRAMHWATFEADDDVRDMGRSLVHGAADFNRSLLGGAQALSDNLFGVGSAPSRMLASAQEWVTWARPEEVRADTLLGQLGYDFLRSAPQQAGNILAALSNPAVALSLMGVQIAGGSYAELREQGVTPQRALVSGLANAVMQAPLEKLSLDRFMGIFNSASFRDTIGRTLGAMGSEFVTEYLQKYPELVTNLWGVAEKQGTDPADQIAWFGRTLFDADTLAQANREAMYEGLIGAMWGGLGGGVRVLSSRQARQQAQAFAEQNTALHDAVEASQTKQIAPDYMEDALDNASDVLAQSVYIPAQAALDLAGQGRDVLTPLGITLEEAQKAAASGVDLEVKLSRVHARLDSAGMTAMNDILRQTPGAPNLRELSLIDVNDEVQAALSDARQRRRRTEAVRQEEQRLVREMAPLVGKEAAETYSKLNSAQARAFEAAYGVDAAGLMRRRSVTLGEEGEAEGQVFSQPGTLPSRFADMPMIEVDSTQWFGPGKAIDADSRNMRKAVHDWARTAFPQGTTVANADTGWGVQVTPSGIKASLHHGYDELLARSVPLIPQIIESGIHLDSIEKKPGLMSHIFANKIRLDGHDYVVGFVLREDRTGNRFYDHELTKIISPDWLKPGRDTSEEALGHRTNRGISPDSLNAASLSKDGKEHATRANRGDVMNILRERLGVNDGTGQILFQPDTAGKDRARIKLDSQTAAIRIFKGADLSSIPHETAHIFVDDLRRVAADDGGIARERLRADMEQAGIDSAELAAILSGDADGEGARALLRDVREELASIEDSKAALRDASRAAGRGKATGGMREDMAAARESNEARRKELLPVERMLSGYVRHLDGLAQARRDMATLRRFAGMAEDGDLTAEQWREVQEYAARGFEQYLWEGKSPAKELDGVFSRMMRWLKNLYASWRQYVGADLDDDVRRVFDRLLVSEREARTDPAVEAAFGLEEDFMLDAGLTQEERARLDELRGRAEAEVTARMDAATARERGKRYRAAFARAKEGLQAAPFWTFIREVSHRDKALTDGEPGTGGIDRASLVEYLGEDMVKDIARKMPKLVNAKGRGDTVDSLATLYPLTDGDADALAHLIYDTLVVEDASVNKLAARQAELALAEQDGEFSPEGELLAGDSYGQYLEAVEDTMRRLGQEEQVQGEQAAAGRLERKSLSDRYYRDMVRREVADMAVAQLDAQRFVAALRRALNERSRAVQRGKPVEAVRAMQRARFAFAMMQEVRKARELADTVQKKARKAARVKPGTYPAAQTEAIRRLVSAFGLPAPQQAWDAQAGNMKLRDLVQQSVDDTEAIDLMPLFPDWLLDLANPDPVAARRGMALDWKALRPLEVEQVGNLLDFLVHSGREQSRTVKESLRARVQAIADEAAASMSGMKTNYASRRDSLGDDLDRGFSSIDTIEWQCRKADGFQNVMGRDGSTEGIMEREVYGPLRAATDRYHARLNSTHKAVMPHLVRLLQSAKAWEKRFGSKALNVRDEKGDVVPVPEAIRQAGDPGWTAEMVIGMALNMGNAGNRERLRSSYIDGNGKGGLTYDMVSLLLGDDAAATLFELDAAAMAQMTAGRARRDGILSAADWQAIQGVWDVFGNQWPDVQAAHKRLYGFAPQGIEPGAFAVRVGDETVRLPGGYYPIKYDPRLDMKMREQQGKEDVLDRSEGIFGIPAARRGFTMGRVTHTGRSLRLGVQALQKHLVDSARFIELGYDVRMADKIINNPTFAAEYQRVFGVQDYDRFRPNLKGLVVDEAVPDSSLLKAAEKARKHLVYYALSMNLNTALMQLTAVFPAVGDVGLVNVSRGLAQLGTRGMGLVREVFSASPYMERRFRNIDDDLARKAMKFEPGRGMTLIRDGKVYTWEDVANLGMLPIAAADCAVTTAIWAGAYHKKMKELRGTAGWKMDRDSEYHSQAVAYADKIIAQSNPDNDALSKSAFARDKGIVRLFNAFSGATTKFAQRTRYMWQGVKRGRVTKWEFARMELYDMLLPALGMVAIKGLAQGLFTGDDDDDKELAKLALSMTMGQFAMAFPVVGNPAADMLVAAMGAGGGRRAGLSTALDTPLQLAGKIAGQGGKVARGGDVDGEKLVMSALDLGSYISKIPVGPVTRRARRGYEQWQEGEGTPLSVIMPRAN
ncbi:LPD3 domain-containing protein [Desulfovibrio sp.]